MQRSEPEDLPMMRHNSSNLSEEKKEEMLTFTGVPLLQWGVTTRWAFSWFLISKGKCKLFAPLYKHINVVLPRSALCARRGKG